VDTRRKELVTEADPNGGIATYSTRERLGLNAPLEDAKKRGPVGVAGLNDHLDKHEL
jgi:cyanide hydratase